jgi:phenylacetate-coenzyme A ligase PaaK-like adenylate-forming protein
MRSGRREDAVFETGVRQLRLALSLVWGRRVNTTVLTRLIDDALATLGEFGEPGDDVAQVVDGPFADPAVRRDLTERAIRRTARRLARLSPFYAQRFAAAGIDPRRLTVETVRVVPLTVKADLVNRAREFVCTGTVPAISTRTTGSTGRPAEVWLSRYETELWSAFAALSGVLRDEIRPTDIMQVCISSRATAAVQQDIGVCRLVGAHADVVGLIPPDEALDSLAGGATLLATYPSYLALLVRRAEQRGMGPSDFKLRRVDLGGEVLSTALAAAAREHLGAERINDTFGMTEVLPVSGRSCNLGHLHHDLNTGYVEVLSLATGEPAVPGELGTVVITPYYPYRECMPVFRYDTRDLVRALPDEPLECDLAGIPATSAILGKADAPMVPPTTTRDLVEALESLPTRPWPARFRLAPGRPAAAGRPVLTVTESTVDGLGVDAVITHLADRGIHVELRTVAEAGALSLRRVRADLLETTFTASAR